MEEFYRKLEIGQKVHFVEHYIKGSVRTLKPAFIESIHDTHVTLWVLSFPKPYFVKFVSFDAQGFKEGTFFV